MHEHRNLEAHIHVGRGKTQTQRVLKMCKPVGGLESHPLLHRGISHSVAGGKQYDHN